MGSNNLTTSGITTGEEISPDQLLQVINALSGNLVPRKADGSIGDAVADLGELVNQWNRFYCKQLFIDGKSISNNDNSNNGEGIDNSNAVDNFNYNLSFVNNVLKIKAGITGTSGDDTISVDNDIAVSNLSFSSNAHNIATIAKVTNWNSQIFEKRKIKLTNPGLEWSKLENQRVFFSSESFPEQTWYYRGFFQKIDNEYFLTDIETTFLDIINTTLNYNLPPLTQCVILKTAWIFTDGNNPFVTYEEPFISSKPPESPTAGRYWQDLSLGVWKKHDGNQFVKVSEILVGKVYLTTNSVVFMESTQKLLEQPQATAQQINEYFHYKIKYSDFSSYKDFTKQQEVGYEVASIGFLYLDYKKKAFLSNLPPTIHWQHPFKSAVAILRVQKVNDKYSFFNIGNDYIGGYNDIITQTGKYKGFDDLPIFSIPPLGYYPNGLSDKFVVANGAGILIDDGFSLAQAESWVAGTFVTNWNASIDTLNGLSAHHKPTNIPAKITINAEKTHLYIPNLQAYESFVRGGATIGQLQGDAIRNIVGQAKAHVLTGDDALFKPGTLPITGSGDGSGAHAWSVKFNASEVVPTSTENRPKNIILDKWYFKIA